MLFENAVAGRQAHPGAFANFLRGEERFEQTLLGAFVHAAAGVGHLQANEIAGRGFGIVHGVSVIDRNDAGGDRQLSAVGHRVARVDDEVHDDLLDTANIRFDRRQSRRVVALEVDILADQAREHAAQLLDQVVEIDGL